MRSMLGNIFLFVLAIVFSKADFSFKLKYCNVKCGCEKKSDGLSEPKLEAEGPTGYYWRDFYGTLPSDAYPLGDKNQYPKTFIGRVFDPSHNGTFLTTIVEGLDYVYNAYNGSLTKISKHIQIMCSKQPQKLIWKVITEENAGSFSDYVYVTAGVHKGHWKNDQFLMRTFYVVKTSKCKIIYVGSATNLTDVLEYAANDGTLQTSDKKMFLLYKNKNEENTTKKTKGKPFISHAYEYSVRAGSIIPNFYKQLNIGSCTIICTNEGIVNGNGKKKSQDNENAMSISAMEYYWQPNDIFDKKEALIGGISYGKKTVYIGQVYSTSFNWLDVGETQGSSVGIVTTGYVIIEHMDTQVLSTENPERFEWVNTTFDNFAQIDKSRLIPGGEMDNGTEIFIGRIFNDRAITPASVRFYESGQYYGYSYYGKSANVQLLMLKRQN